jgi:hypothetical protein
MAIWGWNMMEDRKGLESVVYFFELFLVVAANLELSSGRVKTGGLRQKLNFWNG